MLLVTLVLSGIDAKACDGVTSPDPMTRFQWVRTVDDVRLLFGNEPCRSELAADFDRANRLDRNAYIPAFTLFQLLAAWALRGSGRTLAIAAGVAAIAAALFDLIEDGILLALTAALPGDQAMIDTLFWFPRLKFAALAAASACLGILLARSRDATRWLGWAMAAGAAIASAGLFAPALLAPGIGLAWTALLLAAAARAIRRPAALPG